MAAELPPHQNYWLQIHNLLWTLPWTVRHIAVVVLVAVVAVVAVVELLVVEFLQVTAPCQGDVNLPYGHQPTCPFATQQIGEHTTVRTGYFSLIHSQCCLHTGAIGTRSMVCPGTCNTGLVNTT